LVRHVLLTPLGKLDDALEEIQIAQALDPISSNHFARSGGNLVLPSGIRVRA